MQKHGILQIAYYFPPIKTVGTLRNARFCQTASRYWSHIDVITTAHTRVFDLETAPIGDAKIHSIPSFDFRWLVWQLSGKKATHFSPQLKKKPGISWLRRALDSFPLNVLCGDGGLIYVLLGYWRACVLIKQGNISYVFSSFRPMSDHALAFLLVWRFPQLIWIADFRDVPVDPLQQNVFFPKLQHYILRQMLQRASLLTTVSQGLAQHLQGHYTRQVQVVYNAPLAEQALQGKTHHFKKFTILYTGTLYPGLQSAEPLLLALQQLLLTKALAKDEICLLVCGKDGALWREWAIAYQLDEILEEAGQIPHAQALEWQRSAQLNLLLSWNSPALQGIVTSKVFEYLQAQKPILALVNGQAELELENLLQTYATHSLILHLPWTQGSAALKQFIIETYQSWLAGKTLVASEKEMPSWEEEMENLIKVKSEK